MVTITTRAAEELRNTLVTVSTEPDQILRLVHSASGGFALTLDAEQEGDQVVESEGQKVLLVGADLAPVTAGAVIDIQDTEGGPQLTISQ